MRPLLEAQVVPFEPADPAPPRANPDAGPPPFFSPHVLDPEGLVLDEEALEPVVIGHSVIRPHSELNGFCPSRLNGKGPGRGLNKFGRSELGNLLPTTGNGHIVPAVIRHSDE